MAIKKTNIFGMQPNCTKDLYQFRVSAPQVSLVRNVLRK